MLLIHLVRRRGLPMGKDKFSKNKSLCKLRSSMSDNMKQYRRMVRKPDFVCENCGRAAKRKKNLCRPAKL